MQALQSPFPWFVDLNGDALSAGYVFLGTENNNPETAPATVYWDAAGTQPVPQPIRTINGYPARNGRPAVVYMTAPVSITVRDRRGQLVLSAPSTRDLTVGFVNPMTTPGDLIAGGVAGAAGRLGIGANGQVLTVVGGALQWATPTVGFANPMTAAGDLIVGGALGVATRKAVGTDGQVLTTVGGVPTWATLPSTTLPTSHGFTAQRTTTDQSSGTVCIFDKDDSTGFYNDTVSGGVVYDKATGVFTAKQTRKYRVDANLVVQNASGSAGSISASLRVNGSAIVTLGPSVDAGISGTIPFNLSLSLVQGDTLDIAGTWSGTALLKVGSHFSVRTEY